MHIPFPPPGVGVWTVVDFPRAGSTFFPRCSVCTACILTGTSANLIGMRTHRTHIRRSSKIYLKQQSAGMKDTCTTHAHKKLYIGDRFVVAMVLGPHQLCCKECNNSVCLIEHIGAFVSDLWWWVYTQFDTIRLLMWYFVFILIRETVANNIASGMEGGDSWDKFQNKRKCTAYLWNYFSNWIPGICLPLRYTLVAGQTLLPNILIDLCIFYTVMSTKRLHSAQKWFTLAIDAYFRWHTGTN